MTGDSPMGAQMRAVIVQRPGGVEQLEIGTAPAPEPRAGEVDIEIRACALNRADLLQRRGLYAPPPGAPDILGLECAGVVTRLGAGVTGIAVGARVMALLSGGGYAERVTCPAEVVMPIPDGLSFEQAAAIPEAFLTAAEALFSLGRLEREQTVLIHAAAGGVGSAAVQLAKLVGARVIASAGSTAKLEWVKALGADVVVDHTISDFAEACLEHTSGRGTDVILDFVGASHAARHQRCLAEAGRWVVLGLLGGSRAEIDLGLVLRKRWQVLGLVMRTRSLADKAAIVERFTQRFLPLFARGSLRPAIDRIYPLEQVRSAHERMERNENVGKIVLSVGHAD